MSTNYFNLANDIEQNLEENGIFFSAAPSHKTWGTSALYVPQTGETVDIPVVTKDYIKPWIEIVVDAIAGGVVDWVTVSATLSGTTLFALQDIDLSDVDTPSVLYRSSLSADWTDLSIVNLSDMLPKSSFLELTDTPDTFTDQHGKAIKVKADETGLEFYEITLIDHPLEEHSDWQPLDSVNTKGAMIACNSSNLWHKLYPGVDGTILKMVSGEPDWDSPDYYVKVAATDTTPGYLLNKIQAGIGISIGHKLIGGNEYIDINVTSGSGVITNVHNALSGLQGGGTNNYYHLLDTDYALLVSGTNATNHYHSADRARSVHSGTQLAATISDFAETAQDVVLSAFIDSSSIDFTYNDSTNQISAVALPAGINHDSLQNYVANKHIDHSTITLSAGLGVGGGGTIAANRSFWVVPSAVDHDLLLNFVANEHIDHSTVTMTAGTGLSGGGTIAATRTIGFDTTFGDGRYAAIKPSQLWESDGGAVALSVNSTGGINVTSGDSIFFPNLTYSLYGTSAASPNMMIGALSADYPGIVMMDNTTGFNSLTDGTKISLSASHFYIENREQGGNIVLKANGINSSYVVVEGQLKITLAGSGSTNVILTKETTGEITSKTIDSRVWGDTLLDNTQIAPLATSATYSFSAINADKLDGQHGSYYSPTTHLHTIHGGSLSVQIYDPVLMVDSREAPGHSSQYGKLRIQHSSSAGVPDTGWELEDDQGAWLRLKRTDSHAFTVFTVTQPGWEINCPTTMTELANAAVGYVKSSTVGLLSRQTGVPWADVTDPKPYQLWESDGGAVAVQVDAAGYVGFGTAPSYFLHAQKNQNASTDIVFQNTNNHTNSYVQVAAVSNGVNELDLLVGSTLNTVLDGIAAGTLGAGKSILYSRNVNGMLVNNNSNTPLYLATNNVVRTTWTAAGGIIFAPGVSTTYGTTEIISAADGVLQLTASLQINLGTSFVASSGVAAVGSLGAASFIVAQYGSPPLTGLTLKMASSVPSVQFTNPTSGYAATDGVTQALTGSTFAITNQEHSGNINLITNSGSVNMTTNNFVLPSTAAVYLGAVTTDGSWRIIRSGNNLAFERYETYEWVTKGTFTA